MTDYMTFEMKLFRLFEKYNMPIVYYEVDSSHPEIGIRWMIRAKEKEKKEKE
jgi:hypothetical protein